MAALAAVLSQPLAAQAYYCQVPARVLVPEVTPEAPPRPLPVTGYTLALSWSPAFCRTREFQRAHARQCSGQSGEFGLVVHGLWPESGRSWPQWCRTTTRPTSTELARNLCMTPSARLLVRQWLKHGSCMTRRPETYFRITRILWNSLAVPDLDRLSRQPKLTAGDLRALFAAANSGWSARGVGVKINSNGWLEELRLCYDRRFRPTACDPRRYGATNGAALKIWRGL